MSCFATQSGITPTPSGLVQSSVSTCDQGNHYLLTKLTHILVSNSKPHLGLRRRTARVPEPPFIEGRTNAPFSTMQLESPSLRFIIETFASLNYKHFTIDLHCYRTRISGFVRNQWAQNPTMELHVARTKALLHACANVGPLKLLFVWGTPAADSLRKLYNVRNRQEDLYIGDCRFRLFYLPHPRFLMDFAPLLNLRDAAVVLTQIPNSCDEHLVPHNISIDPLLGHMTKRLIR